MDDLVEEYWNQNPNELEELVKEYESGLLHWNAYVVALYMIPAKIKIVQEIENEIY